MAIRIRGVKAVRSKGRLYYYHRKSMTRLPGEPGTTAFMDRLRELQDGLAKPKNPLPGTVGALIREYRSSPEFTSLADRTRADYLRVFDYLKPLAGMPIAAIDGRFLYGVRDKAAAAKKRRFANYVIQVLRLVFNWGIRRAFCEKNPAVAVDLIRRPRHAPVVNRPWKLEELDAVLAAAPAELRIAIAIGAYVGLREGDMLRVTWACYDGSAFEVRQHKTGGSVWVKAHARLREMLDAAPCRSPIIVVGARGRPFTQNGFQRRFFGLIRTLVAAKKVSPGLSFHGLRHTLGTLLAEAGCDERTIASVLGQATTEMAHHYSRTANPRQLARSAIERLEARNRERKTDACK